MLQSNASRQGTVRNQTARNGNARSALLVPVPATMAETGLVVARFRRHALVESRAGDVYDCQILGRRLRPVVGDNVEWRRERDGTCVIQAVLSRESTLRRTDSRERPEVVAANLSQLIVVMAPHPEPDWFLLDRYLCAAELAGLKAAVAYNKMDLVDAAPNTLEVYRAVGYSVVQTSAVDRTGLDGLEQLLGGERSALIGQSGVGKSSLFNELLGGDVQRVGRLSGKLLQGRHTTTTSVLHRHPGGGEIIDSPGVRNFAPFIERPGDVQFGFREFVSRRDKCRFDDCIHRAEPDCAVKAALKDGAIDRGRYENYEKLYELTASAREY